MPCVRGGAVRRQDWRDHVQAVRRRPLWRRHWCDQRHVQWPLRCRSLQCRRVSHMRWLQSWFFQLNARPSSVPGMPRWQIQRSRHFERLGCDHGSTQDLHGARAHHSMHTVCRRAVHRVRGKQGVQGVPTRVVLAGRCPHLYVGGCPLARCCVMCVRSPRCAYSHHALLATARYRDLYIATPRHHLPARALWPRRCCWTWLQRHV